MAITAYKTFADNDVLFAAELNLSFAQIISNPIDLWSPMTKNAAGGGFKFTGMGVANSANEFMTYGQAVSGTTGTFSGAVTGGSFSTAGTYNAVTITAPATNAVLAIANLKSFTVSNTLTLAGTDSTTMTFPSTSASIARSEAAQSFTGLQTFSSGVNVSNSAIATATTLDWYEEGTFTPVLTIGGSTVGITYTTQTGVFTRIGNLVSFNIYILLSSKGGLTGDVTITTAVPYTSAAAPALNSFYMTDDGSAVVHTTARLPGGSTTISIYNSAGTIGAGASLDNANKFEISGHYRV